MKLAERHELPPELHPVLRRAIRLEVITIIYMITVIALMWLVMGSSQAMKAAWIEDLLTLIPPIAFLISSRLRNRPSSERYPYGRHRTVSIAFLCASLALLGLGGFIFFDSITKLVHGERATIGAVTVFGRVVWLGWLMLPVLLYGAIGGVVLGHLKHDPARRLHDKTLYADAQMNKADWLTAVAAAAGVLGVAMGWWWADSVAALVISLDVIRDGVGSTIACVGDLTDRAPETVDHARPERVDARILAATRRLPWVQDAEVRLREAGHVFFGELFVVPTPGTQDLLAKVKEAENAARAVDWRVADVTVRPVEKL
jgi:cation diffusion facilitator family transporter